MFGLGLVLCIATQPVLAESNYWREKTYADQLIKLLPQRQIHWLNTTPPTLSLIVPSPVTSPKGVALILPSPEEHPDQRQVIQALRTQLPDYGWTSLSVQMPLIDQTRPDQRLGLYEASAPRLDQALQWIAEQNPATRVVVIAHGYSGASAIHYLRQHAEQSKPNAELIKGLVLISLPGREASGNWLDSTEQLQGITLPILDVFAQYDRTDVIDSAPERLRASQIAGRANQQVGSPHTAKVRQLAQNKTGNPRYRQQQVNAARAGFPQEYQELVKSVRSWLVDNPL